MSIDLFVAALQDALGPAYQIGRELGGGGMSRVFVARDVTLQRDVVVKVLAPELAQELSVERFAREIALAAALQHANIVPLLSAGATADGLPYYLMPFVDGESLRSRVEGLGRLPVGDVQRILHDVLRALAWAHARGVVHRDIKTDNVMLAGGAALVTDFGIAKAMSSARQDDERTGTLTRVGTSIGTPIYMAPEQGAGDPNADHRADLYALGAMTYELLTGAPPFGDRAPHALLMAHLTETPVPVSATRPEIPAVLAALVMQCLEKDPDDRPQSAEALLQQLQQVSAGALPTASPASTHTTTRDLKSAGARGLRWAAGAVAVLAAVAGGIWWQKTQSTAVTDDAMLAVMPFTVRDVPLQPWREGLVDVLSRSLDGVSALRIASPSASIAQSTGRADAESAAALGGKLGATLVLFGDMSQMGADSVHLRAALYDVRSAKTRADFDLKGSMQRIDALSDSLALRVLRELGAAGALAGGKLPSLGTSSVAALKAFVEGQRHYRGGRVDSARLAFTTAVRADSSFSLAWRGIAATFIRLGRETDPEAQQALDRAIRFKQGLSPRDSLLLRGDSLRLAVARRAPQPGDAVAAAPEAEALLRTLGEATRRYTDDAELWLELADAGFHFGGLTSLPDKLVAEQFARAVALDSMLLVPYYHGMELALRAGDFARAAAQARQIARLSAGPTQTYYALLADVLSGDGRSYPDAARRVTDTLDARYAASALQLMAPAPDSVGAVVAFATHLRNVTLPAVRGDTALAVRTMLSYHAIMRGRFADGVALLPATFPVRVDLVELGALPADSVITDIDRILRGDPDAAVRSTWVLAARRDTLRLHALADSLVRRDRDRVKASGADAVLREPVARAGLQLARGDSSAALGTLLSTSLRQCGGVPCSGLITATLLVAAGRDADAARLLDRWISQSGTSIQLPRVLLLRAQIAERLGDDVLAAELARRASLRWRESDPAVRSVVDSARVLDQRTRQGR